MQDTGCRRQANPKSEARNPKQIKNPNVKCSKQPVGAALAANGLIIALSCHFERM
jgi:hypothetical protein